MTNFRRAEKGEFEAVRDFYWRLIDMMQDSEYHPAWEKGIYPSDGFLRCSLEAGALYVAENEDGYVGALVIDHNAAEGYEKVAWKCDARGDEVAVIHTLCVLPKVQGQGIGRLLVQNALDVCRKAGIRSVRLDVLTYNLPACRLYEKMGFEYRDTVRIFYEDTGWTDFHLYEYVL